MIRDRLRAEVGLSKARNRSPAAEFQPYELQLNFEFFGIGNCRHPGLWSCCCAWELTLQYMVVLLSTMYDVLQYVWRMEPWWGILSSCTDVIQSSLQGFM